MPRRSAAGAKAGLLSPSTHIPVILTRYPERVRLLAALLLAPLTRSDATSRPVPLGSRVPESLHRVVGGLKVGCSTGGTGAISRAAFQLLHSRYGKIIWAARTPYWFR